MKLSATDTDRLIHLLDRAARLIDKYAMKPREADKARCMRQMIKKLQKKIDNEKILRSKSPF